MLESAFPVQCIAINCIKISVCIRRHCSSVCCKPFTKCNRQDILLILNATCMRAHSMSIAACVTPSSFLFSALTTLTPSLSLNLMTKVRKINDHPLFDRKCLKFNIMYCFLYFYYQEGALNNFRFGKLRSLPVSMRPSMT